MFMWSILLAWLARRRVVQSLAPAALIEAALSGDRVAATELSRRVGPPIRARVLRITRGRPTGAVDVDDMLQEVWGRLLAHDGRRLRTFDATKGVSLEGFVSMIAGQAVAEVIAAQTAQKRSAPGGTTDIADARDLSTNAPAADARVAQHTQLSALWQHLSETLPPRGALVMTMLFVDGLDPAEVVRRTDMKRATVDSWKFKIKKAALAWRKIQDATAVQSGRGTTDAG